MQRRVRLCVSPIPFSRTNVINSECVADGSSNTETRICNTNDCLGKHFEFKHRILDINAFNSTRFRNMIVHFLILTLDSSSIAATYTHTTTTTEAPCVPTVATNPDPVGCRCINFVTGAGDGNCLTASPDPSHCDLRFCYVACTIFSCPSTCQDLIESTVIPGLFYSSQACL